MNRVPRPSVFFRMCAAAFLADMALYLTMTGVPYKALALGAGPLLLGFLPAARALPYSMSTVWAGGLTEGRDRLRWARISVTTIGLTVASLMVTESMWWIAVVLMVAGFGLAFFWPAVQAGMADLAAHGRVAGNLGWFNVAWSTGKATGFVVGGFLLAGFGFSALFAVAAAAYGIVVVLLVSLRPRLEPPPLSAGTAPLSQPGPVSPRSAKTRAAFRRAAWVGNTMAFGVGAALNLHYPEWLEHIGKGEALFGSYLGLIFAVQTVMFLVLIRFPGWRFRRAPLLVTQIPLVAVLAVLPWLRSEAAILVTAFPVGVALGMAYFASVFYSVESPRSRGRNAGMHEALLGIGSLALPALGGLVAQATGDLSAPYYVSGAIALAAILFQARILGRNP